jgi:siroheme decarboxylase
MNGEERRLLAFVQDGIPLTGAPFRDVGAVLGLTGADVISRLDSLIRNGTIRRFGARIDHRKLGILANAMVCWKVPEEKVEETGRMISAHPGVTHCYEREVVPGVWEYNLFCVVHGLSAGDVELVVREIEEEAGITGHAILYSRRKFKHTPVAIISMEHP